MSRKFLLLPVLLAAVGCGGGGGGSGTDQTASGQVDLSTIDGPQLYEFGFPVVEATLLLGRVAADTFQASIDNDRETISEQCDDGGNRQVEFTDLDSSGDVSTGDRVQIFYTNCGEPVFDGVLNGAIILDVADGDSPAGADEVFFNVQFDAFRVTELGQDVNVTGGFGLTYTLDGSENGVRMELGDNFLRLATGTLTSEALPGSVFNKVLDVLAGSYRFSFGGELRVFDDDDSLSFFMESLSNVPGQLGEFPGSNGDFPSEGAARFRIPGAGSQCLITSGSEDGQGSNGPAVPGIRFADDPNCVLRPTAIGVRWNTLVEGTLFADNDSFGLREPGSAGPGSGNPSNPGGQAQMADTEADVIELPAPGFDLVEDAARSQLYVSLPTLNQIAVISTQTMTVTSRIPVGAGPRGIDISADGSTLYAALNGAGAVAFLDIESENVQTIAVQDQLGDPRAWDVVEARPGEVFLSANPSSSGSAYIVKIDRNNNNQAARVASGRIIRARPELAVGPMGEFLYVGSGFSPNSLFKLNLNDASAPIVTEDDHGSVSGTDRLALSSDGTRIALKSGQVLRTGDFSQAGQTQSGVPQTDSTGTRLFVGGFEGDFFDPGLSKIATYESEFFQLMDETTNDCPINDLERLELRSDEQAFYLLGGAVVCQVPRN